MQKISQSRPKSKSSTYSAINLYEWDLLRSAPDVHFDSITVGLLETPIAYGAISSVLRGSGWVSLNNAIPDALRLRLAARVESSTGEAS